MRVEVKELCFSYPGKDVLKGVNLKLDETEIMYIVGPNGSGKSTLVKCIEGLQFPNAGGVFFDGVDPSKLSRQEIVRMMVMFPRVPVSCFPPRFLKR